MEFIFICIGLAVVIYIFIDDIRRALKGRTNTYKTASTLRKPVEKFGYLNAGKKTSSIPERQELRPIDYRPLNNNQKKISDLNQQCLKATEKKTNKTSSELLKPITKEATNTKVTPAIVKICDKCKEVKHETDYYNSEKQEDHLTKWCKKCLAQLTEKRKLGRYKRCPKCKKNRLISSYFDSIKTKDGLSKWCKMCHKK